MKISNALSDRGLTEIPSELIEPYLAAMLSVELEELMYNPTIEGFEESKATLKSIERFVTLFCGIHARIATSNEYYKFYSLTFEQLCDILKEMEKIKRNF